MRAARVRCARRVARRALPAFVACWTALVSSGRCTFGRAGAATAHATWAGEGPYRARYKQEMPVGPDREGPCSGRRSSCRPRRRCEHTRTCGTHRAAHTLTRNRAESPVRRGCSWPATTDERPGVTPATTRRPGVTPATTCRPALSQRASIALDKCESRLHDCVDVLQQHREQISRAEHCNAHA